MAYTETTRTGYGSRLANSLKGIIIGIILFCGATAALWWNEGNYVKTEAVIAEVRENVEELDNPATVAPEFDKKLVHATAKADTENVLEEAQFGVSAKAIKLIRKVEYYQYKEKEHTESEGHFGGSVTETTTYTYESDWSDDPVDSSRFKDPSYKGKNFQLVDIADAESIAETVSFGAYTLPQFLKSRIPADTDVAVNMSDEQLAAWQDKSTAKYQGPLDEEKSETGEVIKKTIPSLVHVSGNTVYFGRSEQSPAIGDVRVKFIAAYPKDVSIIASANGSTFAQFVAKNKRKYSRLEVGTVSSDEMLDHEHTENVLITWVIRAAATFFVFIGLTLMFNIVSMLFKWFPFLGNVVEAGVSIVCLFGAIAWSLLVIAIAWLFYRPILAGSLIAVVVLITVALRNRGKKKVELANAHPIYEAN